MYIARTRNMTREQKQCEEKQNYTIDCNPIAVSKFW